MPDRSRPGSVLNVNRSVNESAIRETGSDGVVLGPVEWYNRDCKKACGKRTPPAWTKDEE